MSNSVVSYRKSDTKIKNLEKTSFLQRHFKSLSGGILSITFLITSPLTVLANPEFSQNSKPDSSNSPQSPNPFVRVIVNSSQDGAVQPNDALTLREAIEIVNGTLPLDQLSANEKTQVSVTGNQETNSRIEFNLPADQTTIALTQVLPPLASPGLVIDGTTQPGYDAEKSATAEITIPIPIVTITPATNQEVFRGFTIVSDNITIRGLSLYGFTSRHRATATLPPADIFIDSPQSSAVGGIGDAGEKPLPLTNYQSLIASSPKNVVIENNWLGIPPDESLPAITSAFGVSVFNSQGTTIRRNRIANHDGSAIITGVQANNLQATENIIVGNGIAGMPDAIRLEGMINQAQINANLICGNDGSGVFMFKPQGAAQIRDNQIKYNGRRFRRAAVYLMGNDHQVLNNQITHQIGPGVVVASYPKSQGNVIEGNRFDALEGLSIDLVAQQNTGVQDYQQGDGPNPARNSPNRRRETGNSGINSPTFVSSEFFVLGTQTTLYGTAEPGSQVAIYRVIESEELENSQGLESSQVEKLVSAGTSNSSQGISGSTVKLANAPKPTNAYGFLSELLTTVSADDQGKFSVTLDNLQPGDQVSAISTASQFGTSEPAPIAFISSADSANQQLRTTNKQPVTLPQCTTKPVPPVVQLPPEPEPEPPPAEPIRLQVPTNIHFALDKDTISPASAQVLNRIATVLQENPALVTEIQGHTDPRASDAYNLDLSNRRALAARNYLLRRGIPPERMTLRALGESQRRTEGRSRLDFARDRRVEFIFKDARGIELIIQEEDLQLE